MTASAKFPLLPYAGKALAVGCSLGGVSEMGRFPIVQQAVSEWFRMGEQG